MHDRPFFVSLAFLEGLRHYGVSRTWFSDRSEASPPHEGADPKAETFGERIGLLGGAETAPLPFPEINEDLEEPQPFYRVRGPATAFLSEPASATRTWPTLAGSLLKAVAGHQTL